MTRAILAAVVLVAGIAAAAAVLHAAGDRRQTVLGESGVLAAADVEPRQHLFGDTVQARVDLLLDHERIDPASVTLRSNFEPYEQVAPQRTERTDAGRLTRLRFVFRLACLDSACMPVTDGRGLTFEPGVVLVDGEPVAELDWPNLAVRSRVAAQAGSQPGSAASGRWALNATDVPPPTFRIAPGVAVILLTALAAVLVVAGVLLLALALRPPARVAQPLPPLERALVLLAAARRTDQPQEERKALDLLSVELLREGERDLAREASELAWARPRPASDATDLVTERVGELVHTRNGSHA